MTALVIALACILIPGALCIAGLLWLLWREPKRGHPR